MNYLRVFLKLRIDARSSGCFKILLDQAKLEDIPQEKKEFIFSLTPHYIGTKYPEDIANLYKYYTKDYVSKLYEKTREIYKWLKAYLR